MLKTWKLRGQGLVEFALILPALLLIVLSIIEGGLLFQSYLAIQHAAREATRYAVTMQPPMEYSVEQGELILVGEDPGTPDFDGETEPAWQARRVGLIKQRALDQAVGIRVLHPVLDETSLLGLKDMAGFFGVRVWGFPGYDVPEQLDHPGLQGLPVRVKIYYRWQPLDPLIQVIVPNGVLLTGDATMINEGVQVGRSSALPPTFAPQPLVPGPTVEPLATGTQIPTPTPTATPTETPAPTPTPTYAPYVVLVDEAGYEQSPWPSDELPASRAKLVAYSLLDDTEYGVYWTANCDGATPQYLGFTLDSDHTLSVPLGNRSFLCGDVTEGETYQTYISVCPATEPTCATALEHPPHNVSRVSVLVPRTAPDLIVTRIVPPERMDAAEEGLVDVVVKNQGVYTVTSTFDVDIYADPDRVPVLKGQPGFLAVGTGAAKQWENRDIGIGQEVTLTFKVMLPDSGEHMLWAQVDTSAAVEERYENNNISGPVEVMAYCSDWCDDFEAAGPGLAAKWTLEAIGSAVTTTARALINTGELTIEGKAPLQGARGGAALLLHQGVYPDSFDMRVKVTDYPNNDMSMAGLMVRESADVDARLAAVGVVNVGGQYYFQTVARETEGAPVASPCLSRSPVPGGEAWVRITRAGDAIGLYTSGNGKDWATADCMQLILPSFVSGTMPLPGITLVPLPSVQYTQTTWRSPTSEAADLTIGGDKNEKGFETHPTYAYGDAGGFAESRDNGAAGGDAEHTDRHAYWGYGLSIDSRALIRGIEVRLDWWLDAVPPAGEIAWLGAELSWDGGQSWTAMKVDNTPVAGGEEVSILGGPADTWGHAWTAAELSNLRVRLSAYSSNVGRDFYLDWVPVRVTYMLDPDPASSATDAASYDYFELCPLDREPPPTRPKPAGLRECADVVANGTFPENTLAPWVDGLEPAAVVPRGGYSCDSSGRPNYGYSMLLRCDRMQTGLYIPFHPWAYQEFTVPSFVSSTQPLSVETTVSLYYLEPLPSISSLDPISGMETYQSTFGSADDELRVRLTDAVSPTTELVSEVVAHGESTTAARDHWHGSQIDLGQSFAIADYAGQNLRLWIDAPNEDHNGDGEEDGDTLFYVDQVRLDICTEAQPPPVPDDPTTTTRKLGGYVRVFLDGFYRPMTGVDVWAIELPLAGYSGEPLGYYSTYSVRDPATGDTVYSFYDLHPGTYQVYAQVWISGRLYWGTLAQSVLLEPNTDGELNEVIANLLLHN